MAHDMWHMLGVKHFLKISASQLLRFGITSVLKILNKRITHLIINKLIIVKDAYRTNRYTRPENLAWYHPNQFMHKT